MLVFFRVCNYNGKEIKRFMKNEIAGQARNDADKESEKSMKTQIAICGYGNLGRGVESEIAKNPDMELAAIFSRRQPTSVLKTQGLCPVIHMDEAAQWRGKIDVCLLCGGSATDLPEQSPALAAIFNIVDSFDTHAKIPAHHKKVDDAARAGGKLAIISVGWDPGLFSLLRLYSGAILPAGETASFWGKGVSQGHSDAIRRIDGVAGAVQYTIPMASAIEKARQGAAAGLTVREKHQRLCYVAVENGADTLRIEREIKTMPDYFADYDTDVIFVTLKELNKNHARMPHGGMVVHAGQTGAGNAHMMEFGLKLDSNPEFTASVMLAYARAAFSLNSAGESGARTVFDIAPRYLFAGNVADAIRKLL